MRKYLYLLVIMLGATLASAQNFRVDGVAQSRSGMPAPGALVAVCTQPANTSTVPCTPLAGLCSSISDTTCTQPNPVTADGLGNYFFYAPPGLYTFQIYGPALTTKVLPDQRVGTSSSSSGGSSATPTTVTNCTAAGTTINLGVSLSTQVVGGVTSLCATTAAANSLSVVGICTSTCGNSGSANVAYSGYANGLVDNQSVQGDYVIPSATPGQFHDIGTTKPGGTVELFGVVASTNTGAGTAASILVSPLSLYAPGASSASGTVANATVGKVGYYPVTGTGIAGDVCTTDGSGNMTCNSLTTSGAGTGVITLNTGTAPTAPAAGKGSLYIDSGTNTFKCLLNGGGNCGGGLVSFTSGNFSPLFNTSLGGSPTTAPALTFTALNAAAGTVFGNPTGSSAASIFTANPVVTSIGTNGSNGGLSGTEGTGASLTAGAGTDLLYPDSGSHCWHFNLNNVDQGCGVAVNGTVALNLGVVGTGSGVLNLKGTTSGTFSHTVSATGTTDTVSGPIIFPAGSSSAPSAAIGAAGQGFYQRSVANVCYVAQGDTCDEMFSDTAGIQIIQSFGYRWAPSATDASGAADTGLGRSAAGVVTVDTSTIGNALGTIKPGLYATGTNCSANGTAANPSVVSCSGAPAGSFSCATNASGGTCTVNTTAVTANSQIFVTEDETLGTRLGVTCNTGTTVIPTSRLLSARSNGTSFTINLGTVTTNPACFSYFIVN